MIIKYYHPKFISQSQSSLYKSTTKSTSHEKSNKMDQIQNGNHESSILFGEMQVKKTNKRPSLDLFQKIYPLFPFPLRTAAQEYGVSQGHFKRICRKAGIVRWPYRQITKAKHRYESLGLCNRAKTTPKISLVNVYRETTQRAQLEAIQQVLSFKLNKEQRRNILQAIWEVQKYNWPQPQFQSQLIESPEKQEKPTSWNKENTLSLVSKKETTESISHDSNAQRATINNLNYETPQPQRHWNVTHSFPNKEEINNHSPFPSQVSRHSYSWYQHEQSSYHVLSINELLNPA
eukprot:gb/GECH01012616.1/.p1 GENE.gb/GECH01012616.1/~~gb/GECH01012616.1/.p1  ORF type:complete len:290 (+),score=68.35 gb/GECH01012616.1/:1-870(+)